MKWSLNQTVDPQHVEPPVEGNDLRGAQTVVGLEPGSGPRRAELLPATLGVTAHADRRPRTERLGHMQDPAAVGVDEIEASVAHGDAVRQDVGAVRQRQHNQGGPPFRDDSTAVRPFEARSDLDRRQRWRGVDLDVPVQRSEQRHRDPGVELAGNTATEHGNAVDGLGEILVGTPRQRSVGETRRDDEVSGSGHPVDGRVPASERVEAGVVPGRYGDRAGLLSCHVLSCGEDRDGDDSPGGNESADGLHFGCSPSKRIVVLMIRARTPSWAGVEHAGIALP